MHWYFLIFSYKLTISNGLSLMTLNSEEFTLCSGSFKWGVHQINPPGGKSENLSLFQVLLLLHRALSFLIRNKRPMMRKNLHPKIEIKSDFMSSTIFDKQSKTGLLVRLIESEV